MAELPKRAIKVVLLGDQGVGKTSLRSQFLYRYFSSSYKATIGADFLMHKVTTDDGQEIELQIWDTAGQERFKAVSRAFYRGADIGVLVYDITNSDTFYNLREWLESFVVNSMGSKPLIMVVGNKTDSDTIRQISRRQAEEFAQTQVEEGMLVDAKRDVMETSAKSYADVSRLFERCGELAVEKLKSSDLMTMSFEAVDVAEPKKGGVVSRRT